MSWDLRATPPTTDASAAVTITVWADSQHLGCFWSNRNLQTDFQLKGPLGNRALDDVSSSPLTSVSVVSDKPEATRQ